MAKEVKDKVNPFLPEASYKEFLEAIPKGVSVRDYLIKDFSEEQIAWLINDLKTKNLKK